MGRIWRDIVALLAIAAVHPIAYLSGAGILHRGSPDAAAYLTLGRRLLANGELSLLGWGHADVGLVLPPVFPFLAGLASSSSPDVLRSAAMVSGAASALSGGLFYLLLRSSTSRPLAFVVAAAIPVLRVCFESAFAPLTESLFVLACAGTLVAVDRFLARTQKEQPGWAVAAGLGCGLVFLTRQVGLVMLLFCAAWLAGAFLARRRSGRGTVRDLAWLVVGFAVLVMPHGAALYGQTGQSPLTQRFRLGDYRVVSDDPGFRVRIDQLRTRVGSDYDAVYRSRRLLRQLIPDGSEMYGHVIVEEERSWLGARLSDIVAHPTKLVGRLVANFGHLVGTIGWPLAILFALSVAFLGASRELRARWPRQLLPGAFVCTYLVAVSTVGDLVSRYATVVAPFAIVQVAIGVSAGCAVLFPLREGWRVAVAAFVLAAGVAGADLVDRPLLAALTAPDLAPYLELSEHVEEDDAVFALTPTDPLLLGATWRVLPDDRLDRVLAYGRRTGVDWLVVSPARYNRRQLLHYQHRWPGGSRLEAWPAAGGGLERCCESEGVVLYRLLPEGEADSRQAPAGEGGRSRSPTEVEGD